jgi:Peptidase A4 family
VRRICLLIVAAAGLSACGAGAAAPAAARVTHAPPVRLSSPIGRGTARSLNWSGYAAYQGGTTFSDVKGSWTQPAASCRSGQKQYASFWVGLDGYNSSSVEQIGTDSDCSGANRPVYYAWYELYPAPPVNLALAVRPGDAISAEVSVSGSTFTLSLLNQTTGASFSTTQTVAGAAVSSAEWVAEAPSRCAATCTVLPLANFGTVNFTGSYASGNGHTGSIGDAAWSNDQIVMVTQSLLTKAQPSPLSADGSAFSVAWKHS